MTKLAASNNYNHNYFSEKKQSQLQSKSVPVTAITLTQLQWNSIIIDRSVPQAHQFLAARTRVVTKAMKNTETRVRVRECWACPRPRMRPIRVARTRSIRTTGRRAATVIRQVTTRHTKNSIHLASLLYSRIILGPK